MCCASIIALLVGRQTKSRGTITLKGCEQVILDTFFFVNNDAEICIQESEERLKSSTYLACTIIPNAPTTVFNYVVALPITRDLEWQIQASVPKINDIPIIHIHLGRSTIWTKLIPTRDNWTVQVTIGLYSNVAFPWLDIVERVYSFRVGGAVCGNLRCRLPILCTPQSNDNIWQS